MNSEMKEIENKSSKKASLRMGNRLSINQKMKLAAGTVIALALIGLGIYFQYSQDDNVAKISMGDYRTKKSGYWNSPSTWEMFNGSAWVNATETPTSANGNIEIVTGHSVTISEDVKVDQTIINEGGSLECLPGNSLLIDDGMATDLTIKGKLFIDDGGILLQTASSGIELSGMAMMAEGCKQEIDNEALFIINAGGIFTNNGGSIVTAEGKWIINSGAIYRSAVNGEELPKALWKAGSICEITGVTDKKPGNMNQNFYNITWNCPEQNKMISLAGTMTDINGDFTLISSGNGMVGFGEAEEYVMNIKGDLIIQNGELFACSSSDKAMINIGGNFDLRGGTFCCSNVINSGGSDGMPVININGNFTVSNGKFDMTHNNGVVNRSNICTINLSGNFIQSGGSISQTASGNDVNSGNGGYGKFVFNKTGTQTFTRTGGMLSNVINWTINSGSTLDMGVSVITGSGSFEVADGGGLVIGSTEGITSTAKEGNVQVTGSRTFSMKGNYIYNGTASQVTGNGLPSIINNLTINNAHHVSLSNTVTINGILNMDNGQLITGRDEVIVANKDKAAISAFSSLSYVRGNLRRNVNSNGTYDFPLGSSSNYEFMNISLSGADGCSSIMGSFINANPITITFPSEGISMIETTINSICDYGYWSVSSNQPMKAGTYIITLKEMGHNDIAQTPEGFFVLYRPNTMVQWQSSGVHTKAFTNEADAAIAVQKGLTTFGHFAIGSGSAKALNMNSERPINFEAKLTNDNVEFSWAPADNNDNFTVERSSDGVNFETVFSKQGNGNSSGKLRHSEVDSKPIAGISYYRLKHTNQEGQVSYSEVKSVQYNSGERTQKEPELKITSVSPNPFTQSFTTSFLMKTVAEVDFQLISPTGQVIFQKSISSIDGINRIQFNDEKGYPGGIYMVVLSSNGEKIVQKVLKK